MRTLLSLALFAEIASGCTSPSQDEARCQAAAALWDECTGTVPSGFDEACAESPSIAATTTGLTCAELTMLSTDSKSDGDSSVFDRWGEPTQPQNFSMVSDGVYRGAHLLTNSKVRFVEQAPQSIKTILDLEMYNPETYWERSLLEMHELTFIAKPFLWNQTYSAAFIDDIVAVMADPANRPIYVHCYYGYDRTGLIVALHRVVNEHWAPVDAFREWKAHMPGADRCTRFPTLNEMFNRKLAELASATHDPRYNFRIDTPNCGSQ